jgi:hypothetical protein
VIPTLQTRPSEDVILIAYYQYPKDLLDLHPAGILQELSRILRHGFCYRQTPLYTCPTIGSNLCYASPHVDCHEQINSFQCNFTQAVDNLRYERYVEQLYPQRWCEAAWIKKIYCLLRPFFPVTLRKQFQKLYLLGWDTISFPRWPVDRSVDRLFEQLLVFTMRVRHIDRMPFIWFWPEGHTACAMLTHDVETTAGVNCTDHLMDIDEAFGIKASFQIVPEKRYAVSPAYLDAIRERGFEINVQGLNHDGRLFWNREEFLRRVPKINHYAQQFGARGFRSPVLYRNADWFQDLCFSYDMSVPNVAHLEPQRGGCCTVMPYFLPGGMLELPLTTIQDYNLFHILGEYSTALWKEQIRLILEGHGLMSFLVHPDYIMQHPAQDVYKALLVYIQELRADQGVWGALPGEVDRWWRERSAMRLVPAGAGWRIEGTGSNRARLAYARLEGDKLVYELAPIQSSPGNASSARHPLP